MAKTKSKKNIIYTETTLAVDERGLRESCYICSVVTGQILSGLAVYPYWIINSAIPLSCHCLPTIHYTDPVHQHATIPSLALPLNPETIRGGGQRGFN